MTRLRELSDSLVALKQRQAVIRQRIKAGLTSDGKKLRRNAACPCGGGKKFKVCCLQKVKAKVEAVSYRNAKIDRMKPELMEPINVDDDSNRTEPERPKDTSSPSGVPRRSGRRPAGRS